MFNYNISLNTPVIAQFRRVTQWCPAVNILFNQQREHDTILINTPTPKIQKYYNFFYKMTDWG